MMLEDVVALLVAGGGYTRVPEPLHVADLSFDFDAVLRGPSGQAGLVVVLEAPAVSLAPARRRLAAFRTVLERSGVIRPLTAVVLGGKHTEEALDEVRSVCRVVAVSRRGDLRGQLKTLLPLQLPKPVEPRTAASAALEEEIGLPSDHPVVRSILRAASTKGADSVRDVVRKEVSKVCESSLLRSDKASE